MGSEFLSDEEPGQNQKYRIDDHDEKRDFDLHAEEGLAYSRKDNRKVGDGSDDQFARHKEIIDSGGGDQHAKGHDHNILPEFAGGHEPGDFLNLFVHF